MNSAILDDKNDTMRAQKKILGTSLKKNWSNVKRKGIQNELLASLNLKNY